MLLLLKVAQLISNLNAAFHEAAEARRIAHLKYPHSPEE